MRRRGGYVYFGVWRLRGTCIKALIVLVPLLAIGIIYTSSYAQVRATEAFSWALGGQIIVIDPGHGGVDPGAVGPRGTLEKDITLAVSKRLGRILAQAGAQVHLTRETDTDLSGVGSGSEKLRDLDNRVAVARKYGARVYISIQANSFGTKWTGAQTFYNSKSPASITLARHIQDQLRRLTPTERLALPIDVYVLNQLPSACVGALVEVGFLSNPEEEKMLNDPLYQEKLAWAIYQGLARFLAGEPEPPEPAWLLPKVQPA